MNKGAAMTNPRFDLGDILEAMNVDLTRALDDEATDEHVPNESGPIYYDPANDPENQEPTDPEPTDSEPYVPGRDGPPPFVYDPAYDEETQDGSVPFSIDPVEQPHGEDTPINGDMPIEGDMPVTIDPVEQPHGEDTPIEPGDIDWGAGESDAPFRADVIDTEDDGEMQIQPVEEEAPAEDTYIEPDPEAEPGPVMTIQPAETDVETDAETDVPVA
jgi:hypothetical protein